jgi:hypothetical protein
MIVPVDRPSRVIGYGYVALVLTLFLAFPAPLPAQDYAVFGEIEGGTTFHHVPDADPELRLSGVATLSATHRLSYSEAEGVLVHSLQILPGGRLSHDVSEGYLAVFPSPVLTLYAGRQRINWGTGYSLSPSDALHPRPSLRGETTSAARGAVSVLQSSPGFLGTAAVITAGANGTVTAAVSGEDALSATADAPPRELWKLLRLAAHGSLFVSPVEATLSLVYQHERAFRPGVGFSVNTPIGVVYAEGAVELHNALVYPERDPIEGVRFESPELWEPYPMVAGGIEAPLTLGPITLTATAEYLFSAVGYSQTEAKLLLELLSAPEAGFSGNAAVSLGDFARLPSFLRRHYGLTNLSIDMAGYLQTEAAAIVNLEDYSGVVTAEATLLVMEGADPWVRAVVFFGGSDDEFGVFPSSDEVPGRTMFTLGTTLHF